MTASPAELPAAVLDPDAQDVVIDVLYGTPQGVMRMSDADWDTVLDTNLKGAFLVTKGFSRAMLKQRSGRIVNISSVIGLIGNAGQCKRIVDGGIAGDL